MAGLELSNTISSPKNVLADRYASREMKAIFSSDSKVLLERQLWVAVMQAQAEFGIVPVEVIPDYIRVLDQVDHGSIREREKVSKHDVKAKVEEFDDLAGHEHAHKGFTSRDLTENVEQLQIRLGLELIRDRTVATLGRFAARAVEYTELPLTGRSHNVAAQTITLGKRFANFGEELLHGYERIENLLDTYPLRGIKGPVGTQQDMLDLFDNDAEAVMGMERKISSLLGFTAVMGSVGQVYPRSFDLEVVGALHQLAGGPSSFAKTLRLMAGHELATEGFKEGQVGSSGMPHKMNTRTSERINGFNAVLAGYVTMAGHLSGDQWNEGDVSCSVVRRVMIPDSFFAIDGLFQSTLTVLNDFGAYPAVIEKELNRYLPFLTSTKILMAAVKAGGDREKAHEVIKQHSVTAALNMRQKGATENEMIDRIAADERLPVTKAELLDAISNPLALTGLAGPQVAEFAQKVEAVVAKHPAAARYTPEEIL